jgi:hypothetical protein
MSGLPLQVADLPPGTVTVRVIRGSFAENLANLQVGLIVGQSGQTLQAVTDQSGRAEFNALAVGELVQARTTVDGETLESQQFALPPDGGVRLVLVAGSGAERTATSITTAGTSWVSAAAETAASEARATSLLPVPASSKGAVLLVLIAAFVGLASSIVWPKRRPPSRRQRTVEQSVDIENSSQ